VSRILKLIGGLLMFCVGLLQIWQGLQGLGVIPKKGESAAERAAETAESLKTLQTVTVPGKGYKLKCPATWKVELPASGLTIKAAHPRAVANFNTSDHPLASELPLAEVWKANRAEVEEAMKKQGAPLTVISEAPAKLGPLPAMKMVARYTLKDLPLRMEQFAAVKGRTVYFLTFTSLDAAFEAYAPVGETAAASFEP
jgi:hypothetical protein